MVVAVVFCFLQEVVTQCLIEDAPSLRMGIRVRCQVVESARAVWRQVIGNIDWVVALLGRRIKSGIVTKEAPL